MLQTIHLAVMDTVSCQQIGSIAKQSGLTIDAIRFYEKQGLLKKPNRSKGGFRLFDHNDLERLRFIKAAQQLGLTLKEVKSILSCAGKGLGPCCDLATNLFTKKVVDLEAQIKALQKTKKQLRNLLKPLTNATLNPQ